MSKLILDLCGGTGSWSRPYVDAGYDVDLITLPGSDVRLYPYQEDKKVYGILAAPPCRCFTRSNRSMPLSITEKIDAHSVVDACLRLVLLYKPEFWALENPPGSLTSTLGKPRYTFQPWYYGGNTQKTTNLWGDFNIPERLFLVRPEKVEIGGIQGRQGDIRRAITAESFSQAFFKANP